MDLAAGIDSAIADHGKWKHLLWLAIETGDSESTPSVVKADNQCQFGKWLYGIPPEAKANPFYPAVVASHAQFHAKAACLLQLALDGNTKQAEAEIRAGTSGFTRASAALTTMMVQWKESLADS